MAKKARKAKARKKPANKAGKPTRKTVRKAKAQKKVVVKKKKPAKKVAGPTSVRKVAKKAASPLDSEGLVAATFTKPAAPKAAPPVPVLSAASGAAVRACVRSYMDTKHHGWNADLKGETRKLIGDYHETQQTIPLILNCVRRCLEQSNFTFVTTADLVQTCVTGTVGDMEFGIYQITTKV